MFKIALLKFELRMQGLKLFYCNLKSTGSVM